MKLLALTHMFFFKVKIHFMILIVMSTLQIHTRILFQERIVQVHCKKMLRSDNIQIYEGLTPDIGLRNMCKYILVPWILLVHARVNKDSTAQGLQRAECLYTSRVVSLRKGTLCVELPRYIWMLVCIQTILLSRRLFSHYSHQSLHSLLFQRKREHLCLFVL